MGSWLSSQLRVPLVSATSVAARLVSEVGWPTTRQDTHKAFAICGDVLTPDLRSISGRGSDANRKGSGYDHASSRTPSLNSSFRNINSMAIPGSNSPLETLYFSFAFSRHTFCPSTCSLLSPPRAYTPT